MTGFYNAPKDNDKFATIAFTDYTNINTRIDFSEARIVEADEYFYLFCYATKASDVISVGEKEWTFKPQLLRIPFAKTTVKVYNSKEKKQVDREQSAVEKMFCSYLAGVDLTKVYSGFMHLQSSGFCDVIVTGKQANGKDVTEEQKALLLESFVDLAEIESAEQLPSDLEIPKSRSGSWGGSKAQTELEKLSDRMTFIKQQLAAAGLDYKPECVADLSESAIELSVKGDEAVIVAKDTIRLSLMLMFGNN